MDDRHDSQEMKLGENSTINSDEMDAIEDLYGEDEDQPGQHTYSLDNIIQQADEEEREDSLTLD